MLQPHSYERDLSIDGNDVVRFFCPKCESSNVRRIDDAGISHACRTCQTTLRVPDASRLKAKTYAPKKKSHVKTGHLGSTRPKVWDVLKFPTGAQIFGSALLMLLVWFIPFQMLRVFGYEQFAEDTTEFVAYLVVWMTGTAIIVGFFRMAVKAPGQMAYAVIGFVFMVPMVLMLGVAGFGLFAFYLLIGAVLFGDTKSG